MFEKGEYEKILEITQGAKEPQEIFIRISSLIQLGRRQEALSSLLHHREGLFKVRPIVTMRADFELRFALGQFDEAYDDLEYFKNLPYVNQEVEEELRELPQRIRAEEKAYLLRDASKKEDLSKLLENKDPYAVLGALSEIGRKGIKGYEEQIKSILVSNAHHDVKVFALEVLVLWKYEEEVVLLEDGERKTVKPSLLVSPFEDDSYRSLRESCKDVPDSSLRGVANGILDQLVMACYPNSPFQDRHLDLQREALLSLAKEYLGQEDKQSEEIENEKKRFGDILKRHPPLP